jgi:putative acetyltransferase
MASHLAVIRNSDQVTVNEQDPQALGFYEHLGFSVYNRTETDEEGRPYPLLYMQRYIYINFTLREEL